jgi:tRNA C32,U32 (ribose-2'-O)-methylase TrmJ
MGLDNETLTLADAIIEVPTSPAFASLNLAQAVLLIGYEWLLSAVEPAEPVIRPGRTRPATRAELQTFFDHLESELDACGFLRNKEKRPTMVRNIRNLFLRTGLFEQELRTLHGIVSELSHGRHRRDDSGG